MNSCDAKSKFRIPIENYSVPEVSESDFEEINKKEGITATWRQLEQLRNTERKMIEKIKHFKEKLEMNPVVRNIKVSIFENPFEGSSGALKVSGVVFWAELNYEKVCEVLGRVVKLPSHKFEIPVFLFMGDAWGLVEKGLRLVGREIDFSNLETYCGWWGVMYDSALLELFDDLSVDEICKLGLEYGGNPNEF